MSWLRAVARMPSVWLFTLLLAVYCLTLSGEFLISDGEVVFQTIVALAERGTLALECNPGLPQILPGVNGQCFSKYGLGMPLLAVPPYRIGRWLTRLVATGTEPIAIGHFAVAFLNQVITAATGVVLYWFARDLYRSRWLGLLLTLLYGLATIAWPYSKVFFSEPLIALLTLLAAYALFRLPATGRSAPAWAALAGLALGYAVLTKVASVILLPFFSLYLLWTLLGRPWLREEARPPTPAPAAGPIPASPGRFIRIGPRLAARQALRRPGRRADPDAINRFPVPLRAATRPAVTQTLATETMVPGAPSTAALRPAPWRQWLLVLVASGLPIVASGLLLVWHNQIRFGSLLESGYSDEGFTTPLYVGLYGFLFSTGKSLFLFSPLTLLCVPAFRWLWVRRPAETLLSGALVLVTLLYYSAWWAWYGGWSWGPRFLVPIVPFLMLPLGALLMERRWARILLLLLLPISIGVQLLGVLIDFNPYIVEIVAGDPANEIRYLFLPWLSPVIGHLRYLVKGQHLTVASFEMTRLGFSPWFAQLFPIVVIGSLLLALVRLVALFRPRRDRRAREVR